MFQLRWFYFSCPHPPVSFRIKLTKAKMMLESRCFLGERGGEAFTSYLKAPHNQPVKTISTEKRAGVGQGKGGVSRHQ